ncbi:Ldh family oxidoreductase [Pseudomonas sp. MDT1-16]
MTYTQYITIVALWEEDNQTVGSLGEKLFLESNTLTPILKKLEAMGFLQRQRDPEDERQVRISLTKNGRQLREGQPKMGLSDATGLTLDEFTNMQQAIVKLRNNLIKSTKAGEVLGCVNSLRAGKGVADAEPRVIDLAPSIVRVDAAGGFSQLAFQAGLPLLEEKTRANGIAALAINRCVHFSALWVEIEQLTAAGLVALACNPSHAWVAPAGGSQPVFGTNPIALDPRRFLGEGTEQHLARAEVMFQSIQGQGARLPSQRRYEARARSLVEGMQIPEALYNDLKALLD